MELALELGVVWELELVLGEEVMLVCADEVAGACGKLRTEKDERKLYW